jgi:hypothetical protein
MHGTRFQFQVRPELERGVPLITFAASWVHRLSTVRHGALQLTAMIEARA